MPSKKITVFSLRTLALLFVCLSPVQLLADEKASYIDEALHLYKAEERWTKYVTTFVEQKKDALRYPALYVDELDSWLKDELTWANNAPQIRAQLKRGYTVGQLSDMVRSLKAQGAPDAKRSEYFSALLNIGNSVFQAAIRPLLDQLMMMEAEQEASMPPVTTTNKDGSVTTQLGEYSRVKAGEKYVTFDFSSPPLPAIDLMALCAGDISSFEPLFNVLQPYAGYMQNYKFAEGSKGPLCKEELYSAPNGGRLYRIMLSQYLGPYELREIRISLARYKSEVRTLSFSGTLFFPEVSEHQPGNWMPATEAHKLASTTILENADPQDAERVRNSAESEQYRRLAAGWDQTDSGPVFIPLYTLEIFGYEAVVNRVTETADFFEPAVAIP
jgi:hypothetical protein